MQPDAKQYTTQHMGNPQKWNRYAYVHHNALVFIDPDGLDDFFIFRPRISSVSEVTRTDMKGMFGVVNQRVVVAYFQSVRFFRGVPQFGQGNMNPREQGTRVPLNSVFQPFASELIGCS